MSRALEKALYRAQLRIWPRSMSWERLYRPAFVIEGPGCFTAGEWTYWARDVSFRTWNADDRIEIGRYCSIGGGVQILAGGDHDNSMLTTYPLALLESAHHPRVAQRSQSTIIGSDVWIGASAIILGDVRIGHGAVIGAGAVISRDVPPYAVAVGSPARVVRHRFAPEEVERLLGLRWWEWPTEVVLAAQDALSQGQVDRLEAFARSMQRLSPGEAQVTPEGAAGTSLGA